MTAEEVEWEIHVHNGEAFERVEKRTSPTLGAAMREIHELLPQVEPPDAAAYAVIAQPHSDRPLRLSRHEGRIRGWTGL